MKVKAVGNIARMVEYAGQQDERRERNQANGVLAVVYLVTIPLQALALIPTFATWLYWRLRWLAAGCPDLPKRSKRP